MVSAIAELTRDRDAFFVTVTVDEGEKYNFGTLDVTTELEELNAEALSRLINIEEGETYNADKLTPLLRR